MQDLFLGSVPFFYSFSTGWAERSASDPVMAPLLHSAVLQSPDYSVVWFPQMQPRLQHRTPTVWLWWADLSKISAVVVDWQEQLAAFHSQLCVCVFYGAPACLCVWLQPRATFSSHWPAQRALQLDDLLNICNSQLLRKHETCWRITEKCRFKSFPFWVIWHENVCTAILLCTMQPNVFFNEVFRATCKQIKAQK